MRCTCMKHQHVNTGIKAEHVYISAMLYATAKVTKHIPTQLKIMTGGPPASVPMMRTPERAVQDVTMLNEKPTIPSRPNERLS